MAQRILAVCLTVTVLNAARADGAVSEEGDPVDATDRIDQRVHEILADPRFQRTRPDGSFELPPLPPVEPFELPDFGPRSSEPSAASGVSEALLWVLASVLGVAVLAVVVREGLRFVSRRKKRRKQKVATGALDLAEVAAERLPAALGRARALAREGRFEEAIHVLLRGALGTLHVLADFSLEPAFTSREVLARAPLNAPTRGAFKDLVMTVEVSLFGGLPVDAGDFGRCESSFLLVYRHLGAGEDREMSTDARV